jgi:hypothetical protein
MGQLQSRQYPQQPDIITDSRNYEFDQETIIMADNNIGFGDYSLDNFKLRKKQVGKLFNKLESNLKMYMLYDNYDTKNEVILTDLKKKTANQEEELKNLTESRDKLMAFYSNKKQETHELNESDNTFDLVNKLLFIILLALIVFVIYKLYTYPLDKQNNFSVNTLLDIDNSKLNNLSSNELDSLDNAYEEKIRELEKMINKNNNSNSNKITSASNNSNTSTNSVNNLTANNIKKRNKLTL